MKKNLFEKVFFIFINLCFTSLGAYLMLFPIMILSDKIFSYSLHENVATSENDGYFFVLYSACF